MKKTFLLLMSFVMLISGCKSADFSTSQIGPVCKTIGNPDTDLRLDTPQFEITCDCDLLRPYKRLVLKAGQSPEVMSCPIPEDLRGKSIMEPTHHTRAMLHVIIPAAADLLGNVALGAFIYHGLKSYNRFTGVQPVNEFYVSTLSGNPIPGLKFVGVK